MADTAPVVGTIKTPTNGLTVQRAGATVTLTQGDNLRWGDVVNNPSFTPVEINMPAQYAGQGETVLKLAPGASAEIKEMKAALADGVSRTEVVALSEGVELYDVSDQISSAVAAPYTGEFSGLLGAGLLGGGAGLAALGAGILGAALLANDNGDDTFIVDGNPNPTPAPTDAPTTQPTSAPTSAPTNPPTTPPTNPPTVAPNDFAGVVGGLDSVNAGLQGSPLEPATALTSALRDGLSQVGPAIQDNNPVADQDPGVGNLLANSVGVATLGYDNTTEGAAGVAANLNEGTSNGAAGTPFAQLTDAVTSPALGQVQGGAEQLPSASTDAGLPTDQVATLLNPDALQAPQTGTPIDDLTAMLNPASAQTALTSAITTLETGLNPLTSMLPTNLG